MPKMVSTEKLASYVAYMNDLTPDDIYAMAKDLLACRNRLTQVRDFPELGYRVDENGADALDRAYVDGYNDAVTKIKGTMVPRKDRAPRCDD